MRSVPFAFDFPFPDQVARSDRSIFESIAEAADKISTERKAGADQRPDKPRTDGFSELLLDRMETAPAEEIVRKLEENGIYSFTGDDADEIRRTVIEMLDKSEFLKRSLVDAVNTDPGAAKAEFAFITSAGEMGKGGSGKIRLDRNSDQDAQSYTLAHEMFHTFGLSDAADMVQAMDVFVAESGISEQEDVEGAAPRTAPQVDYDLFLATVDDWKSAGLLETGYDYDSPEMKDALERFFGDSAEDIDPYQAFSDSSQSFDGDRDRIIQAYVDAKDGGKVEALRAQQLRDMGVSEDELEELIKPPSPLEGMESASGEAIVEKLESLGYYTFEGDRSQELRDGVIECINKSPFFKRSLMDSFELSADNSRMTFKFEDFETANGSYTNHNNAVTLDVDQKGQSLLYTLAHEMFHGFSVRDDIDIGIRDAADMVQTMDVFVAESGIPEANSTGAGPVTAPSVDYDLYRATLDDWHDAGALRQEDYYDNSKPEMKDAMERIFGRSGRAYDPNQAFSDSCQKFDGDRDRIIQAYIDAKDGGKVEALRAEQLRELGIDPEGLKNITELADWYTDNISIDRREVASMDNAFPKEKFIELGDFYRSNINENATEGEIADWIMGQLEFRVESGFDGDGAAAREIFHNHYVKHDGRETLMGFLGSFDATLNGAVESYANGGIDAETRMLFGFKNEPIYTLFKDMVRFFVTNIDPEASAEEAGDWVATQIRDRLGAATGQDEEKLEIFDNYVGKSNRSGGQDASDVATEVYEELSIDPQNELPIPMY